VPLLKGLWRAQLLSEVRLSRESPTLAGQLGLSEQSDHLVVWLMAYRLPVIETYDDAVSILFGDISGSIREISGEVNNQVSNGLEGFPVLLSLVFFDRFYIVDDHLLKKKSDSIPIHFPSLREVKGLLTTRSPREHD
jgi:hypothetical protein